MYARLFSIRGSIQRIRALSLVLALLGAFTAPISLVDEAVEAGYSRHVVEHLPVSDVEAILDSLSPPACRPSPTVTFC